MSDAQTTPAEPGFKDRKAGLVLFGVFQIGLGGLCALMIPLMVIGLLAAKTLPQNAAAPADTRMMVPGLLFYALTATWFIWMGVGSILARRWARALLAVSSWIWLVGGVGGLVTLWLILPDMYAQMAATGQMPRAIVQIVMWVTLGFMLVFYVLVPGALALFYSSRNVRATCEARNPAPCWTDACPPPVLALCLLFGFWACSVLFMGFYNWVTPFFGFLVSGVFGAAIALVTAALLAYGAWGCFRLDLRAWSCSAGLVIAWSLSAAITFSRVSLMDFYAKMNIPPQQLALMKPVCETQAPLLACFFALWIAALLGYLLYLRRFFPKGGEA